MPLPAQRRDRQAFPSGRPQPTYFIRHRPIRMQRQLQSQGWREARIPLPPSPSAAAAACQPQQPDRVLAGAMGDSSRPVLGQDGPLQVGFLHFLDIFLDLLICSMFKRIYP